MPYWINIWMKGLCLCHEICESKLWDTKSIEGFYPILIEFILLRDWTLKNVLHPFIWGNFRNFHSIMNMKSEGVSVRRMCDLQSAYNSADSACCFLHVLSPSLWLGLTNFMLHTWHYALIINISYPENFNKPINILCRRGENVWTWIVMIIAVIPTPDVFRQLPI